MEQKDKIVVIGGFGFIGYYLTKALLAQGKNVIVFGHRSERTKSVFRELEGRYKKTLELLEGDTMSDDLHHLVHNDTNIVGVYHLAGLKTTTQTRDRLDREAGSILAFNYDTDLEVFDFCENILRHRNMDADERTVKLVYVSTAEVYGDMFKVPQKMTEGHECMIDPMSVRHLYPFSKLGGEMMLRHGGWTFDWNVVRLQNPYGPMMGDNMLLPILIKKAIEAEQGVGEVVFEYANDTRPYVYIEDVALGLAKVFDDGEDEETYNLAGDEDVSIGDIVTFVSRTFTNGKLKGVAKQVEPEHRKVDIAKIVRGVRWEPRVHLEEGLRRMHGHYSKDKLVESAMSKMFGGK